MKKKFRIILTVLLLAVLAGSAGMLIRQNMHYKEGAESYSDARVLAGLQEPADAPPAPQATSEPVPSTQEAPVAPSPVVQTTPEEDAAIPTASVQALPEENTAAPVSGVRALLDIDLAALQQVNSDVLGWIMIPGTAISYPLVQGGDNQYYLNRTWNNRASSVGAIFMECMNNPDFSNFNTIIYGHRMGDGSMFNSLKNYKDQAYWSSHPYIYIANETGAYCYEIFSAYEVSTVSTTYQLAFPTEEHKQTFVEDCVGLSVIDTGVIPTVDDQFLTLSTCTGRGHATRWVVQARLEGAVTFDESAA